MPWVYYLSLEKDATIVFTYPYSFGGVVDSFLLQGPSKYFYESLTPSKFLRTSFHQFEKTTEEYPGINALFNKFIHQAFSGLLDRMVELQLFSAEERFKTLLNRSPHILQLVPHKYIANYLGMDPTNFSKLLNTVRI